MLQPSTAQRRRPPREATRSARPGAARPALLLVALALGTTACGGGGRTAQGGRPETARPVGVQPGRQAPDFEIAITNGETFRLGQHRGRVVVLDFLAPG